MYNPAHAAYGAGNPRADVFHQMHSLSTGRSKQEIVNLWAVFMLLAKASVQYFQEILSSHP
jgi:hypothetical protein